jgi:hypothetical protein
MNRRSWTLHSEPTGADYEALLRTVCSIGASVGLTIRDSISISAEATTVLNRLKQLGATCHRADRWPGTQLLHGEATVVEVPVSHEVIECVVGAVQSLFAWRQPMMLEDISVVRSDRSIVLATIAHERDAWLELSASEYGRVLSSWPNMQLFIESGDSSTD